MKIKLAFVIFCCWPLTGCIVATQSRDDPVKLALGSADSQNSILDQPLARAHVRLKRAMDGGTWKEARVHLEEWASLHRQQVGDPLEYYRLKAEILLGLDQPSAALACIAEEDRRVATESSLTRALALAKLDRMTNTEVNELLKPYYAERSKDDQEWERTHLKKEQWSTFTYPQPTDRKSRIASIHVLRAVVASSSSNNVLLERESRDALKLVPGHPLASHFLVQALVRRGATGEAWSFRPAASKLPGRAGYSARMMLNARNRKNARDAQEIRKAHGEIDPQISRDMEERRKAMEALPKLPDHVRPGR